MLVITKSLVAENIRRDVFSEERHSILGLTLRDQSLPEEERYDSYMAFNEEVCESFGIPFGVGLLEPRLIGIRLSQKELPLVEQEGFWKGKPNTLLMESEDVFVRKLENNEVKIPGEERDLSTRRILYVSTNNTNDARLIPGNRVCPRLRFALAITREEYDVLSGFPPTFIFQTEINFGKTFR